MHTRLICDLGKVVIYISLFNVIIAISFNFYLYILEVRRKHVERLTFTEWSAVTMVTIAPIAVAKRDTGAV